jgi:type VI secretion system lysozyme-like protein
VFPVEPKRVSGVRALLFDRLFDDSRHLDEDLVPLRMYSPEELKQSVLREVSRLLNTRCNDPFDEVRVAPRTVMNYGIPDHAHLSPFREEDRRVLGHAIQQAIAAFEPRLRNIHVESVTQANERRLEYRVRAELAYDSVLEPVSFDLEVDDRHTPPAIATPAVRAAGA